MLQQFIKKGKKTTDNANTKLVYGTKDFVKDRFKEIIAMIIVSFLWLLRLSFVPSLLIFGATWFSTNIIPTLSVEVYKNSGLSMESPLMDQFAFFYLPLISFVFIFGLVVVVLVCYTEYKFWKKCGDWISVWFKQTGIHNPFQKDKKESNK